MVHHSRYPRQRSVERKQDSSIVGSLRTVVGALRAEPNALLRLLDSPSMATSTENAIIEAAHLLGPTDQEVLSRALFALLPSATVPSSPPEGDVFRILANIQRENRKDPTYAGFFLPCLELLVRVADDSFRERCRVALLRMLSCKASGRAASERRRFAATSLAGILGLRPSLLEYALRFSQRPGRTV
jgi:hypothetical protein